MPEQPIFKSTPQRFPRAQQRASSMASTIQELLRHGPRSLIGTVVDTTYHVTMGYVTVTTELGLVPVQAVPYGTVVAGMRVYCRQLGGQRTNRTFVFDGYAPNLSGWGLSGSLLCSLLPTSTLTTPILGTVSGDVPCAATLTTISGYYWYCFFYVPTLPVSGPITIWQSTLSTSGTTWLSLELLPTGYLRFWSNDGHGYVSNAPVPPHQMHWIILQPGLASGFGMMVDGVPSAVGLTGPSDLPTYVGGTATYTWSFFSTSTGTQLCPVGTWISKIGYGVNFISGAIVALPMLVPQSDSDLPLIILGVTQTPYSLYRCMEADGSTVTSNYIGGSKHTNDITASATFPIANITSMGPY